MVEVGGGGLGAPLPPPTSTNLHNLATLPYIAALRSSCTYTRTTFT